MKSGMKIQDYDDDDLHHIILYYFSSLEFKKTKDILVLLMAGKI